MWLLKLLSLLHITIFGCAATVKREKNEHKFFASCLYSVLIFVLMFVAELQISNFCRTRSSSVLFNQLDILFYMSRRSSFIFNSKLGCIKFSYFSVELVKFLWSSRMTPYQAYFCAILFLRLPSF